MKRKISVTLDGELVDEYQKKLGRMPLSKLLNMALREEVEALRQEYNSNPKTYHMTDWGKKLFEEMFNTKRRG